MRNAAKWKPSKFVYRKGKLIASRDTSEVQISSRLMADLVARNYDKYLKEHAAGRLLDLGCGQVPLYEAYKRYVSESTCVDWANSLHDNQYLDKECDLTKELPFSDGEFDTIILSDVLEHIPNPEDLWRDMSRILAPEGKLILNVPFFYWLHEQPHDFYRYTEFALKRFAQISELNLVLVEPIGGPLEVLADLSAKQAKYIPLVGGIAGSLAQATAIMLSNTFFGRKIFEKIGRKFPFGYFLVAEKPSQDS